MKTPTFDQLIEQFVDLEFISGQPEELTYDDLIDNQREQLLIAAMKEAGDHAYEFITDAPHMEDLLEKIHSTLNEENYLEKRLSFEQLGRMLVKHACELLEERINHELERALQIQKDLNPFEDDCDEELLDIARTSNVVLFPSHI